MKRLVFYPTVVGLMAIAAIVIYRTWPVENHMSFTTERSFTAQTLAQEAQAIVIGTFQTAKTYNDLSIGQSVLLTDWQFVPEQVLKGTVGKTMTITVEGGQLGKRHDVVEGTPTISRGSRALLYLTFVPGQSKWIPVSLSQGWMTPTSPDSFTDHRGRVATKATIAAEALK